MNTSALKTFAPAVRRQLMEAVTRKLDFALSAKTPDYLTTFAPQVAALRKLAQTDRAGLIDRVAYTWFNRLAALRFMDARGWHPFRARVLTPATVDETQPELLKLTRAGALPEDLKAHTDPARLNDLLDGRIPSPDSQGEVYRHLVLAACRFYHALLPSLFEKLDDETELLLPDDLLTEHSVVHGFRTEISDEDCGDGQRANVEILGWLYQFYISERKDQVMARKSAVPTEDIPAVTQLFTPHWIVRYLVENSLGRLWLLNRPGSRLREHMPYYIEGEPETDFLKITKPEEIRLCDPAVGSGHMLTYAFDLLVKIYEEEGHAPTEIPGLILRHNLHGLEICPRAAQLAELALVFKAREKARRFFQAEHLVRPHIIELRDVRFEENELRDYIQALGLGELFNQPMLKLLHQFEEAKNFGSLIQPCLDERAIADVRRAIEAKDLGGQLFLRDTHLKVLRVLDQAEALNQRYHVVVANPPYMGTKQMAPQLKVFGQERYPDAKADTFAMFIEQALLLVQKRGFAALVTMQSWMFLGSFEALRKKIVANHRVSTMAHLGPHAFDSIAGEIVQVSAFVLQSGVSGAAPGLFLRLIAGANETEKEKLLLRAIGSSTDPLRFTASRADFEAIQSEPIAYWLTPIIREAFRTGKALKDIANPTGGMTTGNNEQFLRLWHEVSTEKVGLRLKDREAAKASKRKWFPYNKGGEFRKWYGNAYFVVNWQNDGQEILATGRATPRSRDYYFHRSITYSATGSFFGARHSDEGFMFDAKGASCFASSSDHFWVLGFLATRLTSFCLGALNPTVEFQTGDLSKLPLAKKVFDKPLQTAVTKLVEYSISIARADWDNFETSWDFRDQPLLRPGLKSATLEASWRNWEAQSTAAIRRMQELETENNRLFIAAYGLDGELQPEVPEEQITLARAEARRDIAAFLSYAVGCMMGRYSPDHPGLVLANAGDTLREFLGKVGKPLAELTFAPDEDGIIPVLDGEWFEDDIVARTRDFLRATFGEATLRENLRFIEDSLGKDLRKYFLNDFYKDHLQTYKKRPIYWLVQSPKKGFSVLLYLHRYTRDTMNLVLNRYLRDYQVKLRNRLAHLTQVQATAPTAREKTEARKEADKITKTIHECDEWERQTVLPLAQARIELDLDEGVKTNYLKLGEALAPIAGLAAKEEE
ncbi:MAG: BREX-1 system adenine-specific DNA-methyltransferase PglX [Prosthecobacter sp.]|uniref:BREX-1 system adenine-specific DNA-methyltransferase PglX n=1 Tax=Prosthecobacter sp. TaxID=1965333 RepID=UPI0025F3107B|nr:BREX-1 system adenine-specific DNA-methyltransferase PglX [Prosthecobacter sp.]MCF7788317.1 BREX-1 system adenine-specific DNA-methyltransferase PglX [Prosthecobacter sp.]